MRPTLVWIVGKGGLLGSHLQRVVDDSADALSWQPVIAKFSWQDPAALAEQLQQAVQAFAAAVRDASGWLICWTAGAGVVSTSEQALHAESATWQVFLELLERHRIGQTPGAIFLASSAGGVYGDSADYPLTEASACSPVSPYGRNKLIQETLLRDWAAQHRHIGYLIGRIANLYGLGQNLSKPQGLIAHMSRCLIYSRPIHLYVPLDTIRDYIRAHECAAHIVRCARRMLAAPMLGTARGLVKIFASEQETSLAQIVSAFTRVTHRTPHLVLAATEASRLQPRRLRFRSAVLRELGAGQPVALDVGIHALHEHHMALYRQGRLPPPP